LSLFALFLSIANIPTFSQVGSQLSNAKATPDKDLHFDVVSIKQSRGNLGTGYRILPNGFRSAGVPLRPIILLAYYPVTLWSDQRIQGAPSWVNSDLFDIEARIAPEDTAAWQSPKQNFMNKEMLEKKLQEMLKERCKLVTHTVPAYVDGYELVVAARGEQLSHSNLAASSLSGPRIPLSSGGEAIYISKNGSEDWALMNTSIMDLIVFLSTRSNTIIIDKTGLTGRYNFKLSGDSVSNPAGSAPAMTPTGVTVNWNFSPLGLELKKTKILTTTLVIDHIERPSVN
jgi:uncharacterized protein (TIGR03435 family)